MKKMLFLMLFLIILGAASVTSQVRIGGNGQPNGAAVLDLNVDDNTNTGTKGLALPRVSLATNAVQITAGTPNLSGMLVYNTNTTLGAGVYYWDTNKWMKVSEVGGVIDATANGGLVRVGSGTTESPYTLGLQSTDSGKYLVKTATGWVAKNDVLNWRVSLIGKGRSYVDTAYASPRIVANCYANFGHIAECANGHRAAWVGYTRSENTRVRLIYSVIDITNGQQCIISNESNTVVDFICR